MIQLLPSQKRYEFLHADYEQIVRIIEPGSKVLDLGCGNGELLSLLIREKQVVGRSIDINEDNVVQCIKKGLSVFQGNIDEGLAEYQDRSYDYTILNQTLQVTQKPDLVLKEMLRVGKKAIVSFPNFANWKVRLHLLFKGTMPKSRALPFEWYNTPNIHLSAIKDFRRFCAEKHINILQEIPLLTADRIPGIFPSFLVNILADEGLFVLSS